MIFAELSCCPLRMHVLPDQHRMTQLCRNTLLAPMLKASAKFTTWLADAISLLPTALARVEGHELQRQTPSLQIFCSTRRMEVSGNSSRVADLLQWRWMLFTSAGWSYWRPSCLAFGFIHVWLIPSSLPWEPECSQMVQCIDVAFYVKQQVEQEWPPEVLKKRKKRKFSLWNGKTWHLRHSLTQRDLDCISCLHSWRQSILKQALYAKCSCKKPKTCKTKTSASLSSASLEGGGPQPLPRGCF